MYFLHYATFFKSCGISILDGKALCQRESCYFIFFIIFLFCKMKSWKIMLTIRQFLFQLYFDVHRSCVAVRNHLVRKVWKWPTSNLDQSASCFHLLECNPLDDLCPNSFHRPVPHQHLLQRYLLQSPDSPWPGKVKLGYKEQPVIKRSKWTQVVGFNYFKGIFTRL